MATLEALLASRRWTPGDLVFQGGTSLHLAHGSPRFSEDLDFLVSSNLKLAAINKAVEARLAGAAWLPAGTEVKVTKAKEGHNPHAFDVTIGGATVIGAVRVKVELWAADKNLAIAPLSVHIVPVRLASGPASGAQAFVPAADQAEIYADKVFALGARPYLKPRDVFDLHWLTHTSPRNVDRGPLTQRELEVRLATYPNQSVDTWLAGAVARRAELLGARDKVTTDLRRWLPPSWPMTPEAAQEMIDVSIVALDEGIALMRIMQSQGFRAPNQVAQEPEADPDSDADDAGDEEADAPQRPRGG